jgi:hypothetical protein
MVKYCIIYLEDKATLEPYTPLDYCEDGYTFDEACDEIAKWHDVIAKEWRERTHPDAEYYLEIERRGE